MYIVKLNCLLLYGVYDVYSEKGTKLIIIINNLQACYFKVDSPKYIANKYLFLLYHKN